MSAEQRASETHAEDPRELTRNERLEEILFTTGFGEVDGVQFDLRHELLPLTEWECLPFAFSVAYTLTDEAIPLIWFPWFDDPTDSAGANVPTARRRKRKAPAKKFGELPATMVIERGDMIKIQGVAIARVGDDFDHLHDREFRIALLYAQDKNGQYRSGQIELRFYGKKSIVPLRYSDNLGSRIYDRICEHFKIPSIEDADSVEEESTNAYFALLLAKSLQISLSHETILAAYDSVNDAVLMGYFWGKAEAELKIKPLAVAASEARNKSREWGKESGQKRRERAKEGWMRIPTQSGHRFRFEVGHRSDLKPATIPK